MNLPNILTMTRMLMVPLFAYLYFYVEPAWLALVVFLLAGATDILDGYLARKWNQITDFGKLMDPLADKLMLLTMMVCLAATRDLGWWIVIAIAAKELLMMLGSALMLKRGVVVFANIWGKIATFLFIVALTLVFPWHGLEAVSRAGTLLATIGVGVSVAAMGVYAWHAYKTIKK